MCPFFCSKFGSKPNEFRVLFNIKKVIFILGIGAKFERESF